MTVDEDRIYSLGSFHKSKGYSKFTESDHNLLLLEIDSSFPSMKKVQDVREEVYNYKNQEHLKKYVEITNRESNLLDCFNSDGEDLNSQCNSWLSCFNLDGEDLNSQFNSWIIV